MGSPVRLRDRKSVAIRPAPITLIGRLRGICMPKITELRINGDRVKIDADPERSLLSVLRDDLDLTGSKYGCGEGQCGACTVLIDGAATRSCITPVRAPAGRQIPTTEGLRNRDRRKRWQAAL